MKKISIILLIASMMVGCLSGCGSISIGLGDSVPSGYAFEVKTEMEGGKTEKLLGSEQEAEHFWSNFETVKERYYTGGHALRLTRGLTSKEGDMATYYLEFESVNGMVCYSFEESVDWNPEYVRAGVNENGIYRVYISEYEDFKSSRPIMMFAVFNSDIVYDDYEIESYNGWIPYVEKDFGYYALDVPMDLFEYKEVAEEDLYEIIYRSIYYTKLDETNDSVTIKDKNIAFVNIHQEYDTGLTYVVVASKGDDEEDEEKARSIINSVKLGKDSNAASPLSEVKTMYQVDDDNDYLLSFQVNDSDMVFNSLTFDVIDYAANGMNITWLSPENINGDYTNENGTLTLCDGRGEYHFSLTKHEGATLECDTIFESSMDGEKMYADDTWLNFLAEGVSRSTDYCVEQSNNKVLIPVVTESGDKGYVLLYEFSGGVYVFQYTEKESIYDDVRAVEVMRSVEINEVE